MGKGLIDLDSITKPIVGFGEELGHITEDVQKEFSSFTKKLASQPETLLQLSSTGQLMQSIQNIGKQLPKLDLPKFELPKLELPKLPFPIPNIEQIKEYVIKYGIPIAGGIIGLVILAKLLPLIMVKKTLPKVV